MSILQSITQGFLRPIEYNRTAHGDFEITVNTVPVSTSTIGIFDGVYGCILPIIYGIYYAFLRDVPSVYLNNYGKLTIDGGTKTVGISTMNWFSRLLGFTAPIAETTTIITAQQTPLFCWFPTHHSFDGSRWWENPSDRFKGGRGPTGGLFGVTLPSSYQRNFRYSTNYSANTYQEAERDYYTISGVDYFPADERSFQTFIDGALTSQTLYSDSGNVSTKGCYYIDRMYEYFGSSPTRAIPRGSDMGAGGIHFDLDDNSKRDNYVFCQMDNGVSRPAQTISKSAGYYEPSFTLYTDDTPDTVSFADTGDR